MIILQDFAKTFPNYSYVRVKTICWYVHKGGELVMTSDGGNVEYNGGIRGIMCTKSGMEYEKFIAMAC